MIATEIGSRIRRLRAAAGIRMDSFVVSRAYLSRIENGAQLPAISVLERMCEAMGTSMRALLVVPDEFERQLVANDSLVREVAPFLKRLDAKQKAMILKTLEAAPRSDLTPGRPLNG